MHTPIMHEVYAHTLVSLFYKAQHQALTENIHHQNSVHNFNV